jgi:hypothetical protein
VAGFFLELNLCLFRRIDGSASMPLTTKKFCRLLRDNPRREAETYWREP